MKTLLLPIKKGEWSLFSAMFSSVCLIHLNFWILRSVRHTIAVADKGGAAELIPFFELWGALPASISLTWILSRLLRKYSYPHVFYSVTLLFLSYFILYALLLYPYSLEHQTSSLTSWSPLMMRHHWVNASFYIMSELWKVALLSILFWGYANRSLPVEKAKRFYAPLLLGGSIAALLAGPITMFSTSARFTWHESIVILLSVVVFSGFFLIYCFSYLSYLTNTPTSTKPLDRQFSLQSSLQAVFKMPYLTWLALLVFADYIAYSMAEVVFLGVLKEYYLEPSAYCHYMGSLTFCSGLLTGVMAIWVAPKLLERFRWSVPALITPLLFLSLSTLFFSIVCLREHAWFSHHWVSLAVVVGSIKHCLLRACKFTLFDTTRELGYIPLSRENQMRGKLVIDGIGSRLGRGVSSVASMGLVSVGGGFIAGAPYAGGISLVFTFLWIFSVQSFGTLFEGQIAKKE